MKERLDSLSNLVTEELMERITHLSNRPWIGQDKYEAANMHDSFNKPLSHKATRIAFTCLRQRTK